MNPDEFKVRVKPERSSWLGSAWRLARDFRRLAENFPSSNGRIIWCGTGVPGTSWRDADWCDRDGRAPSAISAIRNPQSAI